MSAADQLAWMDAAVCAQVGHDPFFGEDGQGKGVSGSEDVKALCRSCEARVSCLSWALQHCIREGVFGGFSERPRLKIAREHRAGRSLEDIIAEDDAAFYARLDKSAEKAAASAELRKARRQEGGSRRLRQAQEAARTSAAARAARARLEIAEAEAAGEQRCTGPCGLVKALGEFSLRKGRRRYGVCKRCRADAELARQRQAANLASPDPQPRKAVAA